MNNQYIFIWTFIRLCYDKLIILTFDKDLLSCKILRSKYINIRTISLSITDTYNPVHCYDNDNVMLRN